MNDMEIESILIKNGFNAKDIKIIRKYSNEDNIAYVAILSNLRKRFLGACAMLIILLSFLVNVILTGEKGDLESYIFAMFIGVVIIFSLTPVPLAGKAFFS